MRCSQCGKPLLLEVLEGQLLCVDCYLKLQQALQIQNNMYMEK